MALKVVAMAELRRQVLLEAERTGEPIDSICARFQVSRSTTTAIAGAPAGGHRGAGGPLSRPAALTRSHGSPDRDRHM